MDLPGASSSVLQKGEASAGAPMSRPEEVSPSMLRWEEVKADDSRFLVMDSVPGLWPGSAGTLAIQPETEKVHSLWPREPDS